MRAGIAAIYALAFWSSCIQNHLCSLPRMWWDHASSFSASGHQAFQSLATTSGLLGFVQSAVTHWGLPAALPQKLGEALSRLAGEGRPRNCFPKLSCSELIKRRGVEQCLVLTVRFSSGGRIGGCREEKRHKTALKTRCSMEQPLLTPLPRGRCFFNDVLEPFLVPPSAQAWAVHHFPLLQPMALSYENENPSVMCLGELPSQNPGHAEPVPSNTRLLGGRGWFSARRCTSPCPWCVTNALGMGGKPLNVFCL